MNATVYACTTCETPLKKQDVVTRKDDGFQCNDCLIEEVTE